MKTELLRIYRASSSECREVPAVRVGTLFIHRTQYWRASGEISAGKTWTISNVQGWSLGCASTRRKALLAAEEFNEHVLPHVQHWRSSHGLSFAV